MQTAVTHSRQKHEPEARVRTWMRVQRCTGRPRSTPKPRPRLQSSAIDSSSGPRVGRGKSAWVASNDCEGHRVQ
jgi:hypothetical protein